MVRWVSEAAVYRRVHFFFELLFCLIDRRNHRRPAWKWIALYASPSSSSAVPLWVRFWLIFFPVFEPRDGNIHHQNGSLNELGFECVSYFFHRLLFVQVLPCSATSVPVTSCQRATVSIPLHPPDSPVISCPADQNLLQAKVGNGRCQYVLSFHDQGR